MQFESVSEIGSAVVPSVPSVVPEVVTVCITVCITVFVLLTPWFLSGIGNGNPPLLRALLAVLRPSHLIRELATRLFASLRRVIRVPVPRRARLLQRSARRRREAREVHLVAIDGRRRRGLVHDRAVQALHRKRQRSPRRGVVVVASFFLLGAFPGAGFPRPAALELGGLVLLRDALPAALEPGSVSAIARTESRSPKNAPYALCALTNATSSSSGSRSSSSTGAA